LPKLAPTVASPKGLSRPAAAFWRSLRDEYDIRDAGGLQTLLVAAQAFERLQAARAILDRDGLVVEDRYGRPKAHPAAGIERDARSGLLKALASLHLDLEPVGKVGRPGGA
jgi:hypothetical protein